MAYTIQCYVKKVELGDQGITSLTIRPTGKSRIEGVEDKCLGWRPEQGGDGSQAQSAAEDSQMKLFCVEINGSISENLRQGLLEAKFHGCEIELKVEEKEDKIVKICRVTLL